ncbi:glycosyltransferase [Verrucomicrobiota bacterium]
MKLSVIVPAHNEEARVGRMLDAYLPHFSARYGNEVEFIVVVNGSTDRTDEVVREYAVRYPCMQCVVEPKRIGKGGALLLGFQRASGDLVGFVDADGATPPAAFDDLVGELGDAGAVIASRWRRGADVSPRQPWSRRMASRVFNTLVRLGFGLRLTDTQCGAKLMRREVLAKILPNLGITRWAFDVDLLFQLKRQGCAIREIPTTWHDVAGSKLEIGRASVEMLAALVRLRLLYSPFRWVVTLYDKFVGPLIHPPGLERDRLFRHSLLLWGGGQVANLFNVLFQFAMLRMLTQVDYGILAAMLGVVIVVGTPVSSMARTMSHFSALHLKQGERGRAVGLAVRVSRDLFPVAIVLLLATVVSSHRVATFFRLESAVPVLITGILLVLSLYRPVLIGVLNGAQSFAWCALLQITLWLARVAIAVALVVWGWAAAGALSAHALAFVFNLVLAAVAVKLVLGGGSSPPGPTRQVYVYFLKYMTALAGYSVLAGVDVVLVKHYFPEAEAGRFAVGANLARAVIFFAQPITAAMFPKVVSSGAASYASGRTLLKAVVLVTVITLGFVVALSLFPGLVVGILAGRGGANAVPVFRAMVWAMAPLSVLFIIINFELAQRRFRITIPLLVCAGAYVLAVVLWHQTLFQVIVCLSVAGVAALVLSLACLPWRSMRRG